MKTYNIKYCEGSYNKNEIKEKLIVNVRNEIQALYKIYEQMQGIHITAIEERKP
jgi:hypothetical protein